MSAAGIMSAVGIAAAPIGVGATGEIGNGRGVG